MPGNFDFATLLAPAVGTLRLAQTTEPSPPFASDSAANAGAVLDRLAAAEPHRVMTMSGIYNLRGNKFRS